MAAFLFPEYEAKASIITVSELNRRAREVIERSMPLCWIAGEISSCTVAASGHCYFVLKDENAQVRCVMFRQKMQSLDFRPQNGMQVEVRATATLFEARGEFQLNIETVRRAGLGALYETFEKLKRKLAAEGLFDASRKKPLPSFPRRVGVVTSLAGSALHDVLSALERRMPMLPVIVYPTAVQGEGSAWRIADAIRLADRVRECDVLIVCRGGGSMEDLWAFNEEAVARAIVDCTIPVISGVGHETDFTIADFVADARAPTPTAAAEMASPNRIELSARLARLGDCLAREVGRAINARAQRLDWAARRLQHPAERLAHQHARLRDFGSRLHIAAARGLEARGWRLRDLSARLRNACCDTGALNHRQADLARRLRRAMASRLEVLAAGLGHAQRQLAHLNPRAVLERGFSIVETADGAIVRDSAQIARGDRIRLSFAAGSAQADVATVAGSSRPGSS